MDELDFFREPELELELPKELKENKYEVSSCIKLDDGYAAYLLSSEGTDRQLLLKRANDPIISLGLANEKKMLDVIHRLDGEFARTFPAAGFFSNDGETSWYMRDYIRGRTLSELVEQSAGMPGLPRNQALGYVIQVTELLDFLHTLEPPIIHRDIKPQNVVVDDEGVCHLIDMGISRIYSSQKGEDTVVMGTRGTMPPEQFGYQQTDQRSDIYSVGVLLLYCLTGDYVANDDALKSVDYNLRDIIRKATQFDPNMRYQTAREILDALLSARYGTISQSQFSERTARRRGVLTAVLAAIVIVFCLAAYPAAKLISTRAVENAKQAEIDALNAPYEFKEPLVEQGVRRLLGKENGKPITIGDLEEVGEFRICGKQHFYTWQTLMIIDGVPKLFEGEYYESGLFFEAGDISTLEDFTHMPNLTTLSLINQNISDISAIADMNLCKLELVQCPITDFSPIESLSSLNDLTISLCDLSDIGFTASLPNLSCISVDNTNVSDLSPLKGREIGQLSVLDCPVTDLSVVNDINGLVYVTVTYDPDILASMTGCTAKSIAVHYSEGDVASLEGLDVFPNLTELTLRHHSAQTMRVYIPEDLRLPNLKTLEFDGGYLVLDDFSGLDAFESLYSLGVRFCDVRGYDGLDKIPNLGKISCSDEAKGAINALYPDNNWEFV